MSAPLLMCRVLLQEGERARVNQIVFGAERPPQFRGGTAKSRLLFRQVANARSR